MSSANESILSDEEEFMDPTISNLVNNETLEWIFVGGKGGVGKTTTSCSLAIQIAKKRKNVLIISTDPAHNVSDAFGERFTNTPTKVRGFDNLYAMEVDPKSKVNSGFALNNDDDLGIIKILPELLETLPGIDEAISFGELMSFIQSLNFSCIILDTAPTGHTLRLLSFPDLIEKAFEKFGSLDQQMGGAMDIFNSLISDNNDSNKLKQIRATTLSVRDIFRDPTRTTFVCVCIPESLSLYETERLIQQLAKNQIDASFIIVNQIVFLPEGYEKVISSEKLKAVTEVEIELLEKYKELEKMNNLLFASYTARIKMQLKYLQQIRDLYGQFFHVVPMPLHASEVRGINRLKEFGEMLLKKRDFPLLLDRNE